jgi:hypothetical protein
MKNVMAANLLINVELWELHHINAAETRMKRGFRQAAGLGKLLLYY